MPISKEISFKMTVIQSLIKRNKNHYFSVPYKQEEIGDCKKT